MKQYHYRNLSQKDVQRVCQRPKMDFKSVFGQVDPIIKAVRSQGDKAVLKYTDQFDGIRPEPLVIQPKKQSVAIEPAIQKAIDTAFDNIRQFHKAQLPETLEVETMPGVMCKRITRPIERVGLYVPGGTAMLPSTCMMLGIPAMLAGCKQIIIATPPNKQGNVADEIIYIAQKLNADAILLAGGAQAVAAMAWGTDSVPKADKILGPGNQYVTAAKMLLQNSEAQVAIDMPAGPSEVLVIADETADPAFVAADLLSQAEHGADSQVVLVATPAFSWEKCMGEIEKQLEKLPRNIIAGKAMKNSFSIQVESLEQAFDFSNQYAPEHLIIQCKDAEQWQHKIINAGSVFIGPWSPESAGDYASGTNHTLPTYGYARMYSGVSVNSFLKSITMQQLSKEGLKNLGPTIETLAELEKLEGHKHAVSIRLNRIKNE
ncbi:MAG: histidinol dehydrogenase [Balneolaceae bacterium]|nr:histidinol dehydrogenase [Balneolaceae bacterium]